MGNLVFTRYVTLKNGRRLDAHDYGKQAFVFEGDPQYATHKAERASGSPKQKLAEVSSDTSE